MPYIHMQYIHSQDLHEITRIWGMARMGVILRRYRGDIMGVPTNLPLDDCPNPKHHSGEVAVRLL